MTAQPYLFVWIVRDVRMAILAKRRGDRSRATWYIAEAHRHLGMAQCSPRPTYLTPRGFRKRQSLVTLIADRGLAALE